MIINGEIIGEMLFKFLVCIRYEIIKFMYGGENLLFFNIYLYFFYSLVGIRCLE